MKPRLLDLFCGAGGAAVGYHRAGFVVVGVDIKPQPNYPFEFWQQNALEFLRYARKWDDGHETEAGFFDAIHASPPCQGYTTMRNRHGSSSPLLISETRQLLVATGLPYVIENVLGARRHMVDPYVLSGKMFGLGVHRPRLFETNWPWLQPPPAGAHRDPVAVYGKNDQRRLWTRRDGSSLHAATLEEASVAMGIDWMTWDELREAIPPAYTELIGHQLLAHLSRVAA